MKFQNEFGKITKNSIFAANIFNGTQNNDASETFLICNAKFFIINFCYNISHPLNSPSLIKKLVPCKN